MLDSLWIVQREWNGGSQACNNAAKSDSGLCAMLVHCCQQAHTYFKCTYKYPNDSVVIEVTHVHMFWYTRRKNW